MKKSLLGKSFSKPVQATKSAAGSRKASATSKLVSARLTTTKLSTTRMVVGKANLRTGRAYF